MGRGGAGPGLGGGIYNGGELTMNNSTVSGNAVGGIFGTGSGGGIANLGTATINNSTISGNSATVRDGGIVNEANLKINNSTISANKTLLGRFASGIDNYSGATITLQNSIIASNSGLNCSGTMTSNGYNLSSDASCDLKGPGDLNNTNPQLGPLQYNGGPTQTMALPSGSRPSMPAIRLVAPTATAFF